MVNKNNRGIVIIVLIVGTIMLFSSQKDSLEMLKEVDAEGLTTSSCDSCGVKLTTAQEDFSGKKSGFYGTNAGNCADGAVYCPNVPDCTTCCYRQALLEDGTWQDCGVPSTITPPVWGQDSFPQCADTYLNCAQCATDGYMGIWGDDSIYHCCRVVAGYVYYYDGMCHRSPPSGCTSNNDCYTTFCEDGLCVSCTLNNFKCDNNILYECNYDSGIDGNNWIEVTNCNDLGDYSCIVDPGELSGRCEQNVQCKDLGETCSTSAECCAGYGCYNTVCAVNEGDTCPIADRFKCDNNILYSCGSDHFWNLALNCDNIGTNFSCTTDGVTGSCEQQGTCHTEGQACQPGDCCGGLDCVNNVCEAVTCSDTDGGDIPTTKGSVTWSTDSASDNCLATNLLQEYYCATETARYTAKNYVCSDIDSTYLCYDGKCGERQCDNDGTCEPSIGEANDNCPQDCPATITCLSLGGTKETQQCSELNKDELTGATDLGAGEYCCGARACNSNTDCDSNKCQECSNGKCVSKCLAFLQSCDGKGNCEINPLIFIIGGIFLALMVFKTMNKDK